MEVRKILGNIVLKNGNHAIAKLANGYYAVGNMFHGKRVSGLEQFHDFDKAFEHWYDSLQTIPLSELVQEKQ